MEITECLEVDTTKSNIMDLIHKRSNLMRSLNDIHKIETPKGGFISIDDRDKYNSLNKDLNNIEKLIVNEIEILKKKKEEI